MSDLKVQKKDGSSEDFSYDKLVASIGKTGVDSVKSEVIAKSIESWILDTAKDGLISSSAIRDKLIEELMKVDTAAAENYRNYKKS